MRGPLAKGNLLTLARLQRHPRIVALAGNPEVRSFVADLRPTELVEILE